jgi:16S rRNA (cytidine1402-2'-O)-methyltransferase
MPALYVVATPIGNQEDITLRALRVLREVGLIAAEDTRKTRQLLSTYGIGTPLTSYHEHNKRAKLPYLLSRLEKEDIALVSEAGMPGLSDPGYELIRAAVQAGIPVIPVPGPSVVTTALVVSGLPSDQFIYLGFLPRKQGARKRLLESIAPEPRTIVAFEAPHRLRDTLSDILQILGDRQIAVCRELTKVYEEVFRGKTSEAIAYFQEPRGEFTLVIEGERQKAKLRVTPEVEKELHRLRSQGLTPREAIAQVSRNTGLSRRELYGVWLRLFSRP